MQEVQCGQQAEERTEGTPALCPPLRSSDCDSFSNECTWRIAELFDGSHELVAEINFSSAGHGLKVTLMAFSAPLGKTTSVRILKNQWYPASTQHRGFCCTHPACLQTETWCSFKNKNLLLKRIRKHQKHMCFSKDFSNYFSEGFGQVFLHMLKFSVCVVLFVFSNCRSFRLSKNTPLFLSTRT